MPDSIEEKHTPTAVEFISNFQNESVSLENLVITEDIYFRSENYKVEKLFLKDIQFKGQLIFDKCDIKNGIKFLNCQFDKDLFFSNCSASKIDFKLLRGDESIVFVNCKINFRIDIRTSKFDGGLVFNNSLVENVHIDGLTTSVGGIIIENKTELKQSMMVSNCNCQKGDFRINESTITGSLRLVNNLVGAYDLAFSYFNKTIYIWAGRCHSVTLYQNQFAEELYFKVVKVASLFSIIECDFSKLFQIELDEEREYRKGNLNSLYISQCDFKNVFSVKKFEEDNSLIKKIDIVFKNLNGSFHFDNLLIDELNISGFNKDSRLVLDNVVLEKLNLEKFRNSGSIDFINVRPEGTNSQISFKSSILGSFAFINCQLDTYQQFEICDSIFDQVISSGTKWFDFRKIERNSKPHQRSLWKLLLFYIRVFFFCLFEKSIDWKKLSKVCRMTWQLKNQMFKNVIWVKRLFSNIKMLFFNLPHKNEEVQKLYQIREIFRQLKVSMDKQGNRIQGLFFQSQEFIAYEKELKLTHCIYKPERLILWSNSSNSHGQDWLKPLFLGVMFTGLWFIFMVISMNPNLELHLPWNCNFLTTYKIYAEYFKGVPDLFNPTFRLDLVFATQTNEFTFLTYFWALIQRISISYFIFQTISAFRKYMK